MKELEPIFYVDRDGERDANVFDFEDIEYSTYVRKGDVIHTNLEGEFVIVVADNDTPGRARELDESDFPYTCDCDCDLHTSTLKRGE